MGHMVVDFGKRTTVLTGSVVVELSASLKDRAKNKQVFKPNKKETNKPKHKLQSSLLGVKMSA